MNMKKVETKEKKQKMKQKRKLAISYLTQYTLFYIITVVSVFGYFAVAGKALVLSPTHDGYVQHYTSLAYYGQWLREILTNLFVHHKWEVPTWSFSLGYGSDVITTLHYYVIGDPLALLSVAVPARYTEYLYDFLVVLRYYLAGLAFSYYCLKLKKSTRGTMAGAFTYIFCGYALFAFRHHFFINPMIYLPLLLLGVEKVLKKQRPYLFIGMVAVCAISNFYFFYMIVLMVVTYVIVRLVMLYEKGKLRESCLCILRMFGYAVVGVVLSAIIFLPVVLFFLGDNRGGAGYVFNSMYSFSYFETFLQAFISSKGLESWTFFGYTPITILAIILLFRKRGNNGLKAGFLILTLFLLFPIFGHVFNGFSYICNRWNFGYGFVVALILTTMWEEFTELTTRELTALGSCTLFYLVASVMLKGKMLDQFRLPAAILVIGYVVVLLGNNKKVQTRIKNYKQLVSAGLFVLVLAGIAVNGMNQNAPSKGNYPASFLERGTSWSTITKNQDREIKKIEQEKEEQGFFRYTSSGGKRIIQNASLISGLSSTQYYWSLQNGAISQYLEENANLKNMSFKYWGVDERVFLNTLANVKYYVSTKKSADKIAPFGFEKNKGDHNGYHIYENTYVLPFGYTYDSYIPRNAYEEMSAVQKQEAMMQGIVLEESPEEVEETKLNFTGKNLSYQVECEKGVTYEDGVFKVARGNKKATLTFEGVRDCELYLEAVGLHYTSEPGKDRVEANLKASANGVSKQINIYTNKHIRYTGRHDFIVNLCYSDKERTKIELVFDSPGEYSYSQLNVVSQPMTQYVKQVEALKVDTLKDVVIGTNSVTGDISLDQSKILCLTIPYSKGWKAYVDGKETELLQANTMYMALPLTEGQHSIELRYQTPGLKAGVMGTGVGVLMLAGIVVYHKRKRD